MRAARRCAIWCGHARRRCACSARDASASARFPLHGIGRIYAGKQGWTLAYRRWLTTVHFDHPAQQIVRQDYIHAVTDAEDRVEGLTRQIEELVPQWSMAPAVEALQAIPGVGRIVAVIMAAEVGDLSRFNNPRQLMAYPGLTRLSIRATRDGSPGRHHQGRQRPCPASVDRRARRGEEPSRPAMSRFYRPLDRGSLKTKPRSCGIQPAHESLLDRRLRPRRPPWASL